MQKTPENSAIYHTNQCTFLWFVILEIYQSDFFLLYSDAFVPLHTELQWQNLAMLHSAARVAS